MLSNCRRSIGDGCKSSCFIFSWEWRFPQLNKIDIPLFWNSEIPFFFHYVWLALFGAALWRHVDNTSNAWIFKQNVVTNVSCWNLDNICYVPWFFGSSYGNKNFVSIFQINLLINHKIKFKFLFTLYTYFISHVNTINYDSQSWQRHSWNFSFSCSFVK